MHVICCTYVGIGDQRLYKLSFSVILIDESTQVDVTEPGVQSGSVQCSHSYHWSQPQTAHTEVRLTSVWAVFSQD